MSLFVLPASATATKATRVCFLATRPVVSRVAVASSSRFFSTGPARLGKASDIPRNTSSLLQRTQWPRNMVPSGPSGLLMQRRSLWGDNDVITMYEQLPRDYKDVNGLPFRRSDLTQAEITAIFGPGMPVVTGNTLLKILHGRRVAGTLEDPAYFVNTAVYTAAEIATALAYLRKNIQVDETINAGLRAQDELDQIERQIAQEERKKLAAAVAAKNPNDTNVEFDPSSVEIVPDPVYGYSKLDKIRTINKARLAAEKAKLEAEAAAAPPAEPGSLMEYVETGQLTATSPSAKKWLANATVSDLEDVPDQSTFNRVAPTITFAVLFLAGCYALTALYEPPEDHVRFFNDVKPATACVGTLIALNALAYAAWRTPPLWRIMNRYFVLVVGLPKPPTIVLAMFSHNSIGHLVGNMATLYFFGPRLHDDLGRANFLSLYLSCGVVGYVASLLWHPLNVAALGASCAVLGVVSAYFWLHRFDTFKILNLPPDPMQGVPGLIFLSLVVALHISALMSKSKMVARLDLASHWGGILTGIAGVQALEHWGRVNGVRTKGGQFRRGASEGDEDEEVQGPGRSIEILTGEKTV